MCDKFYFPVKVREGRMEEVILKAVYNKYRVEYLVTDTNEIELKIDWEFGETTLIIVELFTKDLKPISDQMLVVNACKVCFKFSLDAMHRDDESSTDKNASDERNVKFAITTIPYLKPMVRATAHGDAEEDYSINYENERDVFTESSTHLGLDMRDLIDGDLSDATFRNGRCEFKVHTTILSARSPVFRDFFKDPSNGNEIKIPDATDEALKVMIDFIYSGLIGLKSVDRAEELYELACKYKLEDLRRACSEYMTDWTDLTDFTTNRVVRTLILAKKHEDEKLKKLAIKFISENLAQLKSGGKLLRFVADNADLMSEILSYTEGRKEKKVVDDFLAHTPSKKPRSSEDKEP